MNPAQQFCLIIVGQVTAICLVAAMLSAVWRHSAASRHSISLLGLALILATPLVACVLPQAGWWWSDVRWDLRNASLPDHGGSRLSESIVPVSDSVPAVTVPELTDADVTPETSLAINPATPAISDTLLQSETDREPRSSQSAASQFASYFGTWLNLAAAAWLAGTVVMMAKRVWQQSQLRRLIRQLSFHEVADPPIDPEVARKVLSALNLKRLPPISVSDLVPMPMVLGMWRSTIVLPRGLLTGSATRLRDVLIHECAHVKRKDPWINAAQQVAGILWWWHPGVVWLNRQISRSREEICDNFVLRHGDPPAYAQTLLELAELCSRPRQVVPMLGLLGSRWTLEERIAGLLKPERNTMTRARRRTMATTAVILGMMCVLVGGVRGVEDLQDKPKSDASTDQAIAVNDKPAVRPANVATRKIVIRGTCHNENAEPVPGCKVCVYWNPGDDPLVLLAETKADSNGEFRLREIETEMPNRRDLVVIASADKHVPAVTGPSKADAGVVDVSLRLSSNPGTLSGIVTDPSGQPLKGVTVYLGGSQPYPGIWSSVTDENGRYSITDMKRWTPESTATVDPRSGTGYVMSSCFFYLKHPDYALTLASNTGIPQQVDVTMKPPAIVEGQVIDRVTNRPAQHVTVSAQGVARGGWLRTRTDANGRYRLQLARDHYNIWAEADDRIAIAVKALLAEPGKTVSDANIPLVKGGFVIGKVVGKKEKADKTAVPDAEGSAADGPIQVAHYGPARPRTGAAVTSTNVQSDGTYRLRVAPGVNYVYVMSGGNRFVDVNVEDGQEVTVNFDLNDAQDGFRESTVDEVLAATLRKEAENEDELAKSPKKASAPVARKRRDSAAGNLLNRLQEQNAGNARFEDPWCKTLKELVDLGPTAVPELIEELDATNNDTMLRCLGFTLRAINDKRAVPALIRAIPKTLLPPGSDMGCQAKDPALLKFMQQHEIGQHGDKAMYAFGRPVREIFAALHKLTGQKFDERQLQLVFLDGLPLQRQMKRQLYDRTARQWSGWWEQNWSLHLQDAAYSRVQLPELADMTVEPPAPGTHFKTRGSHSNHLLESILDPASESVLLDFDTGRVSSLPEKWRKIKNINSQIDEFTAWAAGEGFDMFGTEYISPNDGKQYFALRPIGLRAWELGKHRWKMSSEDFTLESLQGEGSPANGLLLHYNPVHESFEPKEPATFLFVTRAGTPGLLFVGIEVNDATQQAGRVTHGDNELNPTHFRKGRRFAWTDLQEVTPRLPDNK